MSKVTIDQLRKTLKSLTGNEKFSLCKTFEDVVEQLLTGCESFRAPFYINDVSVIEERLMVYNHKMYNAKSVLCEQLASKYKEVVLIVDSVLPAKQAIHFATLTNNRSVVREWLGMIRRFDFMVRQIDFTEEEADDYILTAPLTSFLKQHGNDT
jgi:hypothetical protein